MWVRVMVSLSSSISSSTAVTVTTCEVSHFWAVKVSVVLSKDRSVPAPPMVTVTSPTGCESRTTV